MLIWVNIDKPTRTYTIHKAGTCTYVIQKKETKHKGIGKLKEDGGWLPFESMDYVNKFIGDKFSKYEMKQHC
ncbi:hypothetical protein [Cytobacillus sp. FSL H8-0458]|uniref:hypothetical protein n=1 Tax=Cytobacillus sp. FSL H8-0458 TaxID=2975346 RepID=UPI0030FBDF50